ncbi:HIT zinc finger [Striga asiatica]|uniref:HIT zinc finger n=1 Tax=Striga asiatica TaxID=4170 RepID=A0A5A7PQI6_STRAF|nr:HIT zinc finger [Striga asiatica]
MPRKTTRNSKMENKSVVLHKKLRELETELADLVPYGGGGGGSSSDSISYPRSFPGEEAVEELFSGAEEDAAVRKEKAAAVKVAAEEKAWRRVGKYGGVFGCGVIVGAICVMEWFFAAIAPQLMEYEALLLPPT